MPITRYFIFVGSLLLALVFLADSYWPNTPSSGSFMREAQVDKSIIRLQSAHRWPTAINFDTSQPTIVPPPAPVAAEAPAVNPPREAFARLEEPTAPVAKPAAHVRAKRKIVRRAPTTRLAEYPVAQDPFFGRW